ncbi:hypothetical protein MBAV_004135 [Candidatus Magnetobacterium bavaricum]|uniref:Uncharacterized protein n=1 Tax=Candidatus Magnetobacterium bavaricum TaxID=29290 RepID=A0A0F3GNV9_9BACT|nr:hypothetical protein MBAV_004135 [Candidatus Magnetobacterium bavaricum]
MYQQGVKDLHGGLKFGSRSGGCRHLDNCVVEMPGQLVYLVVALGNDDKQLIWEVVYLSEGVAYDTQKPRQGIPRIPYELLRKEIKEAVGIRAHAIVPGVCHDVHYDIDVQGCGLLPAWVDGEVVKMCQTIRPGLLDNELPVLVRMAELFKICVDPILEAVVLGHNLLYGLIPGVDRDLDLVVGEVYLKRPRCLSLLIHTSIVAQTLQFEKGDKRRNRRLTPLSAPITVFLSPMKIFNPTLDNFNIMCIE